MQQRNFLDRLPFLFFCLLPFVYFFIYKGLGLSESDGGFIASLSYRITIGENIGTDFIYVRPPLSPYFHALEIALLPDHLEMLGMRFWFYACMWLSVFFGIKALQKVFPFQEMGVAPWMLGILAYVYALHAFPPMPWHTSDGILFAMLGFFLVTRGPHWAYMAGGMCAFVLSAMAKQPFAVSIFAGAGILLALYPWRQVLKGFGITAAIGVGVLALILAFPTTRAMFSANIAHILKGASRSEEFFRSGVLTYGTGVVFGIAPALLWVVLRFVLKTKHTGWIMALVVLTFVAIWVPYQTYAVYKGGHFRTPRFGFYHLLLVAGMCGALLQIMNPSRRKAVAMLLAMGIVSWASGISWGYTLPVLLCLPGIAGVLYFLTIGNNYKLPRWALVPVALLATGGFLASAKYPYQEKEISQLTYHLGDLYPRLNGLYTHKARYDKHARFKELHQQYGDNFAVLPAFPMAHYLTNTKPVSVVDWEHDGEMAYEMGVDMDIKRFESRNTTVFVERELMDDAYATRPVYRCSVLNHVLSNWHLMEEDSIFLVYQMHPEVSGSDSTSVVNTVQGDTLH